MGVTKIKTRGQDRLRFERRGRMDAPVGVVGVGAMGASLGLGLREMGVSVWGYDTRRAHAEEGVRLGALSRGVDTLEELAGCSAIFVAVPVGATVAAVRQALELPDAVVMDVASIKAPIAEAVENERFVPTHPMRGTHLSGPGAARNQLFAGANWAICRTPHTSECAYQNARDWIEGLGACPVDLSARLHDQTVASTSHLPHVVASGLVGCLERIDSSLASRLVGDGFWDTTRIAQANPDLWADIVMCNSAEVRTSIGSMIERMSALDRALETEDRAAINEYFEAGPRVLWRMSGGAQDRSRKARSDRSGRFDALAGPALTQLNGAF